MCKKYSLTVSRIVLNKTIYDSLHEKLIDNNWAITNRREINHDIELCMQRELHFATTAVIYEIDRYDGGRKI